MSVERVVDLDDPRLADYTELNDPAARRRRERAGGWFIAEGLLVLEQLLASRFAVRSLLVADDLLDRVLTLDGAREVALLVADAATVERLVGFPFHRGVLASAERGVLPAVDEVLAGADRVLVVEGVNDHENLGGLFRNAAALGVDAVLLDPTTADPLYRRSVRVSVGHVLRVPWTRGGPVSELVAPLHAAGVEVVALTPDPTAVPLGAWAAERAVGPLAVLVGAEGPGLSPTALAAADHRVRVEMAPGVDSLNVATAAAIALHQLRSSNS